MKRLSSIGRCHNDNRGEAERTVGDATFFQILRAYYERYQNSNATTDDFIAVAEEVSGQEVDALFQAWLYDEAVPDVPELEWGSGE